ncbi:MAG: hypothetical protein NPMRTHETA2_1540001 [Nitrosopumilales archaeon]|nr:MAG: hypothetical protein NPMRTHETA2_1540001 [Nitrosopumilales archaeon]
MSYAKNIAMQFEFVQKMWANSPNFPKSDGGTVHGHDPVIGQHQGAGFVNLKQNDGSFKRIPESGGFAQWVTTTAGEYFFSPSISALKNV